VKNKKGKKEKEKEKEERKIIGGKIKKTKLNSDYMVGFLLINTSKQDLI
jgi:hypothetical protein